MGRNGSDGSIASRTVVGGVTVVVAIFCLFFAHGMPNLITQWFLFVGKFKMTLSVLGPCPASYLVLKAATIRSDTNLLREGHSGHIQLGLCEMSSHCLVKGSQITDLTLSRQNRNSVTWFVDNTYRKPRKFHSVKKKLWPWAISNLKRSF